MGNETFCGHRGLDLAGCLATDIEYYDTVLPEGGGLPSPNLFSSTLPTCFLGEAAIQFGLTGPTLIVNAPAEDALSGVRLALESLFWGECGTMLAGISISRPNRRSRGSAPRTPAGSSWCWRMPRMPPQEATERSTFPMEASSGTTESRSPI